MNESCGSMLTQTNVSQRPRVSAANERVSSGRELIFISDRYICVYALQTVDPPAARKQRVAAE